MSEWIEKKCSERHIHWVVFDVILTDTFVVVPLLITIEFPIGTFNNHHDDNSLEATQKPNSDERENCHFLVGVLFSAFLLCPPISTICVGCNFGMINKYLQSLFTLCDKLCVVE